MNSKHLKRTQRDYTLAFELLNSPKIRKADGYSICLSYMIEDQNQ